MADDVVEARQFQGQLRIDYADSSDRTRAGNGLELFPLINFALRRDFLLDWWMSPSEKVALIFLLEQLRPKVAIEIGTKNGGSLQALAKFSEQVYSIDIDPDIPIRLGDQFPNVEYLTGSSDKVLPPLIDRLQNENAELSFALVDGDHSAEGVRKDIDNLLKFHPTVPFYIVMHDSFNPQCRLGLTRANWAANPQVHAVELDFVAGGVNSAPAFRDQLWGGLALGILLPDERQSHFEITGRSERTHKTVMISPRLLVRYVGGKIKRTLPGHAASKAKRMLLSG